MTGPWSLDEAPRGELLPDEILRARWSEALPQMLAVVAGETDPVALQATLAALLYAALPQTIWCGFYRRVEPETLAVGPYQGSLGCLRIALGRGVCGTAARTGETQRVPDVMAFPGHIACDSRSRSELVVPVRDAGGAVRAVLDLDAAVHDGFAPWVAQALEGLCRQVFGDPTVRW